MSTTEQERDWLRLNPSRITVNQILSLISEADNWHENRYKIYHWPKTIGYMKIYWFDRFCKLPRWARVWIAATGVSPNKYKEALNETDPSTD